MQNLPDPQDPIIDPNTPDVPEPVDPYPVTDPFVHPEPPQVPTPPEPCHQSLKPVELSGVPSTLNGSADGISPGPGGTHSCGGSSRSCACAVLAESPKAAMHTAVRIEKHVRRCRFMERHLTHAVRDMTRASGGRPDAGTRNARVSIGEKASDAGLGGRKRPAS